MQVFDAAGLALFAVSGAGKALAFHAGPVAAMLLGMLTGIGGGMVRDVLLREIPTVLRAELYAVAALIGAAVVVGGRMLHLSSTMAASPAQSSALEFGSSRCDEDGSFRKHARQNKLINKPRLVDETGTKFRSGRCSPVQR